MKKRTKYTILFFVFFTLFSILTINVTTNKKTITYGAATDYNWNNSSANLTRIYPKLEKMYNLSYGKYDIDPSKYGLSGLDFYDYGMQGMTITDKYLIFTLVYNPNNHQSSEENNKKNTLLVIADKDTYQVYNIIDDYCFGHANDLAYNSNTGEVLITANPWYSKTANSTPIKGRKIAAFKINNNYQLTNYRLSSTDDRDDGYSGFTYDSDKNKYIGHSSPKVYDVTLNFIWKEIFSTTTTLTFQSLAYKSNKLYLATFEAGQVTSHQQIHYNSKEPYSSLIYEYDIRKSSYPITKTFYISGKDLYGELDNIAFNGNKMIISYQFDNGKNSWKVGFYSYDMSKQMSGWQKLTFTHGTHYYYFQNGKPLTGWQHLDYNGKQDWYYFNSDGIMQTGWQYLDYKGAKAWYYFNSSGAMQTGWQNLDYNGKKGWYYFCELNTGCSPTGEMLTGLRSIAYNGRTDLYLLRPKKDQYGSGPAGEMVKGLQTVNNKVYYFRTKANEYGTGPTGSALKNTCQLISNEYQCFGSDGARTSKTAKQEIPTAEKYCNNLTYTGKEQVLTKTAPNSYTFKDNKVLNVGTYNVSAVLNKGYIWKDGTTTNQIIKCSIKDSNPKSYEIVCEDNPNNSDVTTCTLYANTDEEITSVGGDFVVSEENTIENIVIDDNWKGSANNDGFNLEASKGKTGTFKILTFDVPKKKGSTIKVNKGTMKSSKNKKVTLNDSVYNIGNTNPTEEQPTEEPQYEEPQQEQPTQEEPVEKPEDFKVKEVEEPKNETKKNKFTIIVLAVIGAVIVGYIGYIIYYLKPEKNQ